MNTYCLLLTENCNFACTYCYEANGNGHTKKSMTIETAKSILDYMLGQGDNEVGISLFGGEPTLNPDVIEYILVEGKRIANERGITLIVSMITNGSIITDKIYDIFKRHLDIVKDIQISIDGDEPSQNLTRIDKAGNGTFDIVKRNLPRWRELFPGLSVHGVVSKDTLPMLFHNYKMFSDDWGLDRIWFLTAKDVRFTQDDVAIYDSEMFKIKEHMMEKVRKNGDLTPIRSSQPLNALFRHQEERAKPCGVGDGYMVITADGDIYPCHNIYFADTDESTKLGDIYNGVDPSRQDIWKTYGDSDMIGCDGCEHTKCFRCPAENYTANGSPFVQDKGNEGTHCSFMKIDLKYQKEILKEAVEMGLLDKYGMSKEDRERQSGQGDHGYGMDQTQNDVVISDDPNENLKNLLDEVIGVLVKYHNKL